MENEITKKRTAIVGAGASGLVAAFYTLKKPGNTVVIFEKNSIPGKKLRVTGNGKCNFTNADLDSSHYLHYDEAKEKQNLTLQFVSEILRQNGREDFFSFLESLGMMYVEKNGYYYPSIERAGEFCDILCKTLREMGADFRFDTKVKEVSLTGDGKIELEGERFDALVLACGGKAAPNLGSEGGGYRLARNFGHTVSFTYPVLVPLQVSGGILSAVAGVRVKARVTGIAEGKILSSETGEIQFNENNLSGIAVFQLSRHLTKAIEEKKDVRVKVDFLPEVEEQGLEIFVEKRKNILGKRGLREFYEGIFQKKLLDFLTERYETLQKEPENGNKPQDGDKLPERTADSGKNDSAEYVDFLKFAKNCYFRISGHGGYPDAQCTRGGVILTEVKENLESKLVPGLYFTGEILDIDGDCGGYNLQWAFSCGKTVGDEL